MRPIAATPVVGAMVLAFTFGAAGATTAATANAAPNRPEYACTSTGPTLELQHPVIPGGTTRAELKKRACAATVIAEALASGRPVILTNVVIDGVIELRRNPVRLDRLPLEDRSAAGEDPPTKVLTEWLRNASDKHPGLGSGGFIVVPGLVMHDSLVMGGLETPRHVRAFFEGEFDASGTRFIGPVKLDGAIFKPPAVAKAATFESPVSMVGAFFNQGVDFTNTRFAREATFSHVQVGGAPISTSPTGTGEAIFQSVEFRGRTQFDNAAFHGDVSFTRAVFGQSVDLNHAHFRADVDARLATFGQAAIITDATFCRRAKFVSAAFAETAQFSRTRFLHFADFAAVKLPRNAAFDGAHFGPIARGALSRLGQVWELVRYAVAGMLPAAWRLPAPTGALGEHDATCALRAAASDDWRAGGYDFRDASFADRARTFAGVHSPLDDFRGIVAVVCGLLAVGCALYFRPRPYVEFISTKAAVKVIAHGKEAWQRPLPHALLAERGFLFAACVLLLAALAYHHVAHLFTYTMLGTAVIPVVITLVWTALVTAVAARAFGYRPPWRVFVERPDAAIGVNPHKPAPDLLETLTSSFNASVHAQRPFEHLARARATGMPQGIVALGGVRGAGKSTVARTVVEDPPSGCLSVRIGCAAHTDQQAFAVALYRLVCTEVQDDFARRLLRAGNHHPPPPSPARDTSTEGRRQIDAVRELLAFPSFGPFAPLAAVVAMAPLTLWLWPLISTTTVVWLVTPAWLFVGGVMVTGLYYANATAPIRTRLRQLQNTPEGRLYSRVLVDRDRLDFERELSNEREGGVELTRAVGLKMKVGTRRRERARSFADLVQAFQVLVEDYVIDAYPGGVVLVVDDVDKLDDPSAAAEFVGRLRALLAVPGVLCFVPIGEALLDLYRQRGLLAGGGVDQLFDDVIEIAPFTVADSVRVLARRRFIPEAAVSDGAHREACILWALVVAVLAGGNVAELLRLAREVAVMFGARTSSGDPAMAAGDFVAAAWAECRDVTVSRIRHSARWPESVKAAVAARLAYVKVEQWSEPVPAKIVDDVATMTSQLQGTHDAAIREIGRLAAHFGRVLTGSGRLWSALDSGELMRVAVDLSARDLGDGPLVVADWLEAACRGHAAAGLAGVDIERGGAPCASSS